MDKKAIKVKIIQSPTGGWYEDCIGQEFEVVDYGRKDYVLAEDYKAPQGMWRHILKADAEVVPELIKMVERKSWNEFRKTGLFMFVNTILHAFGWALVVEQNLKNIEDADDYPVIACYPARVKYRGFDNEDTDEMHKKIGAYLAENAADLKADTEL